MAIQDRKRLVDGQLSFEGGVDTGRAPHRIDKNQVALLVNGTCRGDTISQRPGFRQCSLTFSDSQVYNPNTQQWDTVPASTVESAFIAGYFQGHRPFKNPSGPPYLHLSVSGKIYRINLITFVISEITLTDPTDPGNPADRPMAWFEQAENTHVWQDGQSIPLFITTGGMVRSDVNGAGGVVDGKPKKQVPIGRAMGYANGRLTVSLPDGVSYVVGDLVGSDTGELYFTENNFLATNHTFRVPGNVGSITSIQALANLDTSLGQGPCQVFTDSGAFSFNAPPDATTWQNLTYPINTVSMINNGPAGDYSVVNVNSDKWYRGSDGNIWSFQVARRDFGMWSNTALSHEVSQFIDNDYQPLLDRSSGAHFQDWMLQTCQPQFDTTHGVWWKGIVALDLSPVTGMVHRESPAWDGMWTGQKFMQLSTIKVEGKDRCFCVVLGTNGLELWEIDPELGYDLKADGTKLRIVRAIEFARLVFENPQELKELETFEMWRDNVVGTVDINLFYRPDQYPCWFPWQSSQECVLECVTPVEGTCATGDMLNARPGFKPRWSAQKPPDYSSTTGYPTALGYMMQARLEITGQCDIINYRMVCRRADEDLYGACLPTTATTCPATICCGPDNVLNSIP